MEILAIILIYIIGVFATIALLTYLWAGELDGNEELVAFLSILSWIFIVAMLLIFIAETMWSYVIKYPFVWFYKKCKEKFENKRK